jgi:prepilin peptidase CpaA
VLLSPITGLKVLRLKLSHEVVYAACALLCAIAGAGFDIATRRIPNILTVPAIVFGLALHAGMGGWRQSATAAVAGLVCGLIFLVFHVAGGMGGGDVKLMAAVGCCSGLWLMAPLLLWTSLAGGVLAIGLALCHRRLKQTLVNVYALAVHHATAGLEPHREFNISNPRALRLPYGLAIAAGSACNLGLLMVQR